MNTDKDFVPYQPSLDMKEIGFDKPCLAFFTWKNELKPIKQLEDVFNSLKNSKVNTTYCSSVAPTFSQAFRWFREKHNWQHSIEPTADQHSHQLGYNYWIWNYKTKEEYHTMPKNRPSGDWEYKTYEEAEQACLDKLIEICKNK